MKLTHYLSLVILLFCAERLTAQYEDCNAAFKIADKVPINVPFVTNNGLVQDQVIDSCFQDFEHKSYWIKFKAISSGTFEFMLTPNGLAADYDFIMYDGCPCDPTKNKIACKWQGELVTNFKPTGIAADPLLSFGVPPAQAAEFVNTVNLIAGKTYFILLDNISASIDPLNNVGFSLIFGGTAVLGPTDETEPGISNLTISGPAKACINQKDIAFSATVSSSSGASVALEWTGTNGIVSADTLRNTLVSVGSSSGVLCIKASDGCYAAEDTCVSIEVTSTPDLAVSDTTPCHNNFFDLTGLLITDANNSTGGISFFDQGNNAAKDTLPISSLVTSSGLYFVQKKVNSGCKDTASIQVLIQDLLLKRDTFNICANETRLDTLPMTELNGYGASGLLFTYYSDSLNAYAKKNNLLVPLVNMSGTYWLRGDSKEGCYAVAPVVVNFIPFPQLPVVTNYVLCDSCLLLDTLAFPSITKPYSTKVYPSALFAELELGRIFNVNACNTGSYAIRLTAANGCYAITAINIQKINPPVGIISGTDSICPIIGKQVDLNFNFTGVGPFTGSYWDGTNTQQFSTSLTSYTEKVTVTQPVTFTLLNLKDANSGFCDNAKLSGAAVFKQLDVPKIDQLQILCDSNRSNYSVSFTIKGGHQDYVVNGVSLAGNTFTSNKIPNDTAYQFLLQDVFGCLPDTIRGAATCQCTNTAGTFSEKDTLLVCANGLTSATLLGQTLGAEDKLVYVLHDRPDAQLGNIAELSSSSKFPFSNKLNFNQVYYLSAIVGDSLLDGTVDFKDNCLSVAAGRPVLFLRPDTVTLGLDTFYCKGTTIQLKLLSNHTGLVDLGYSINGKLVEQKMFAISSAISTTVDSTLNFSLQYVRDAFGCAFATLDTSQEIKALPKLQLQGLQVECDSVAENFTVKFAVGAAAGSILQSTGTAGQFQGNNFTSISLPNGQNYSFLVRDQFRCDSILVQGSKVCPCVKQQGAIDTSKQFICFGDSVNINVLLPNQKDPNDTTLFGIFSDPSLVNLVGVTAKSTISSSTVTGIVLGNAYYVSLITGNKQSSAPFVNLNFCHVKTLPKMIVFLEKATLQLPKTRDTICPNDTVNLQLNFSGSFPILFSVGAQSFLVNQNNFDLPLTSQSDQSFSFKIIDQLGCVSTFDNYFDLVIRKLSIIGGFSRDTIETCLTDTIDFTLVGTQKAVGDTIFYEITNAGGSLITRQSGSKILYTTGLLPNAWYTMRAIAVPIKNGIPQFQSNCRVPSKAVHFRFQDLPVAKLLAASKVCMGDSLALKLSVPNDQRKYLLTIEVDNNTLNLNPISVDSIFRLFVNQNSTIKLIGLQPLTGSSKCIPLIDSALVAFSVVQSPTLVQSQIICAPDKLSYQLELIVTSDLPSSLKATGVGGSWSGNTFLSSKLVAGQGYNVTITDGNNCKALVVSGIGECACPPNAKPAISIDKPVSCFNDSDAILSVSNVNGKAPFKFQWSNQSVATQLTGLKAGLYKVTMTDKDNCISTDSILLSNPGPLSAQLLVTDPKCPGLRQGSVRFDAILGGTPPYQYQFENQVFNTLPVYDKLVAGTYNFTLKDSRGCALKFVRTVTDPPVFVLDLGRDTSIAFGDSILLEAIGNQVVDSLAWSSNVLCYGPNCAKPFAKPKFEYDIYSVVGFSANGCKATAQKTVTTIRQDEVYIPNVFSPESSQLGNQRLFVFGGRTIAKIKRLAIFDRWGNQLFLAENLLPNDNALGWDGTFNGKAMSEGVYVYYAEIEKAGGAVLVLKGDVTLVRQ